MVRDIRISDFDYTLPDCKIARHPLARRDACRLLVSRNAAELNHEYFFRLPEIIPHDSLLVCNDTRVINARIKFYKDSGAEIEVFLLEPIQPHDYVMMFQSKGLCRWSCLVGNLKRWKDTPLKKKLKIDGRDVILTALKLNNREGNAHEIEFAWDDESLSFASIVDAAGYIPIPPYLKRDSEETDADDYQTIFARIKGSVAAPTAGLHFTPALFEELKHNDIDINAITLHVGAGTFQPVKSEAIGEHPMHKEVFSVSRDLIDKLIDALKRNRKIIAVGTTTVRTLESLPYIGRHLLASEENLHVGQWEPYEGKSPDKFSLHDTIESLNAISVYLDRNEENTLTASTSILIAPGFHWSIVEGMITNFHQPQSTLLLLVSSFLGKGDDDVCRWKKIYNAALDNDYRFLSYGDACYFER